MSRTPIMAGNWKMNLNHIDAVGLVQKLAWTLADEKYDRTKCEAVVIPPFTDLRTVQTLIDGDKLPIAHGAQDLSQHDDGAYTGDISADMLVKLDCKYVVIGHSERREYHNESDELVNAKAIKALAKGLIPIICCGEALDVRKEGRQVEHVVAQIKAALAGIAASDVARLVIAYEPIWAIGTGKTATAEDAQSMCAKVRDVVRETHGAEAAAGVRVQYGGSVKPGNIVELMSQPDIDGALVGGASLDADEFAAIVQYRKH